MLKNKINFYKYASQKNDSCTEFPKYKLAYHALIYQWNEMLDD